MANALVRRMIVPHHETRNDEETPMNPHETIVLAEQHRAELIDDAANARRYRRRPGRRTLRDRLARRPGGT